MSITRRYVADQLCDDAHALLSGADPLRIAEELETRMEELQEISDDETRADRELDKEKTADAVNA